ncbi:MAG: aldehyde dehydrogenase [Gammaproteobacteria bacterium]|nr:MAG: aldehyde dehydrogenase [Gammaproteobacteria bacterium]
MNINQLVQQQQAFFNRNTSKAPDFRIAQLQQLKQLVRANEKALCDAVYSDFKKSAFDAYLSEFSLFYSEINLAIKRLKTWSQRRRVATGWVNFPAKSYIVPEPLGVTLVIGAWNYPIQLALVPVVSTIAAGNTVILKPSELPAQTAKVLAEMINRHFPAEYFHVVEGGIAETTELLACHFDKIFFTGSAAVGKKVYQAAAKHLTPVTLELGGKSPTVVLADCDMAMTTKRLVWAKYFNAGQTCVSPDYVLVDKRIEQPFLAALKREIARYYPQRSQPAAGVADSDRAIDASDPCPENYVQIINHRHFDRLQRLIDAGQVYYGGQYNREQRLIAPTILHPVHPDEPAMQEEIFGPILPVMTFAHLDDAIADIKRGDKPLACYVYGKDKKQVNKILSEVAFGGGAVNDSMMHLANHRLPFGGVGGSGLGSYHGQAGFASFSHYKSLLHKPFWLEAPIKYAPYSALKLWLIRRLLG